MQPGPDPAPDPRPACSARPPSPSEAPDDLPRQRRAGRPARRAGGDPPPAGRDHPGRPPRRRQRPAGGRRPRARRCARRAAGRDRRREHAGGRRRPGGGADRRASASSPGSRCSACPCCGAGRTGSARSAGSGWSCWSGTTCWPPRRASRAGRRTSRRPGRTATTGSGWWLGLTLAVLVLFAVIVTVLVRVSRPEDYGRLVRCAALREVVAWRWRACDTSWPTSTTRSGSTAAGSGSPRSCIRRRRSRCSSGAACGSCSARSATGRAAGSGWPTAPSRRPADGTGSSCRPTGLDAAVDGLRSAGARFRTDVIEGVGVRQVVVEDPSGNPVELFEPLRPEAGLDQG